MYNTTGTYPANTKYNKHVIISSKRRFDVIIVYLLRFVFAGLIAMIMLYICKFYRLLYLLSQYGTSVYDVFILDECMSILEFRYRIPKAERGQFSLCYSRSFENGLSQLEKTLKL